MDKKGFKVCLQNTWVKRVLFYIIGQHNWLNLNKSNTKTIFFFSCSLSLYIFKKDKTKKQKITEINQNICNIKHFICYQNFGLTLPINVSTFLQYSYNQDLNNNGLWTILELLK